jgi:hypothetical protein
MARSVRRAWNDGKGGGSEDDLLKRAQENVKEKQLTGGRSEGKGMAWKRHPAQCAGPHVRPVRSRGRAWVRGGLVENGPKDEDQSADGNINGGGKCNCGAPAREATFAERKFNFEKRHGETIPPC